MNVPLIRNQHYTIHHTVRSDSGFTMLEVLLAIVLVSILAGMSIPVYQSFQARNDLGIAAGTVAHALRRAQTLSRSVASDSSWGVYIQNESVTLFRGVNYANRDEGDDEISSIPGITTSGLQEIVFSRLSGEPVTTGSLTLTSLTNETRTITINEKGTISY